MGECNCRRSCFLERSCIRLHVSCVLGDFSRYNLWLIHDAGARANFRHVATWKLIEYKLLIERVILTQGGPWTIVQSMPAVATIFSRQGMERSAKMIMRSDNGMHGEDGKRRRRMNRHGLLLAKESALEYACLQLRKSAADRPTTCLK